jgi:hypothetical protein
MLPDQESYAVQLLDDAMDCIPLDEKQAFVAVAAKAPHLIMRETNPIDFLRFENFNAWDAAYRLAKYWEWKKRLFGSDRMFLPIKNVDGNGALTSEDIEQLRTGYCSILPRDNYGNSVVAFDRSRYGADFSTADPTQHFRIVFYTLAITADEQRNSPSGTSSLVVVNVIYSIPKIRSAYYLSVIIRQTSPIHVKCCHSIFMAKREFVTSMLQLAMPIVERNLRHRMPGLSFHLCLFPEMARQKLEEYGLQSDGIPTTLGGRWQYDNFSSWITNQEATNAFLHPNQNHFVQNNTQQDLPCRSINSNQQNCNFQKQSSIESLVQLSQRMDISGSGMTSCPGNTPLVEHSMLLKSSAESIHHSPTQLSTHVDQPVAVFVDYNSQDIIYNFQRYHNFDTTKATEHFTSHIELRKVLFGDRAYLPMHQTGCKLNNYLLNINRIYLTFAVV